MVSNIQNERWSLNAFPFLRGNVSLINDDSFLMYIYIYIECKRTHLSFPQKMHRRALPLLLAEFTFGKNPVCLLRVGRGSCASLSDECGGMKSGCAFEDSVLLSFIKRHRF